MDTGEKVKLIGSEELERMGVPRGTEGIVQYETWVYAWYGDEPDALWVEFVVNGQRESWAALKSELELVA